MAWQAIVYIIFTCSVRGLCGRRVQGEETLGESEENDADGRQIFQESVDDGLGMITLHKALLKSLITEAIQHERTEMRNLLREELSEQSAQMLIAQKAALRELIFEGKAKENRHAETEEGTQTQKSVHGDLSEQSAAICSCTGLFEEFQRTTEELQILPLSDELIEKVIELQEGTGKPLSGNAGIFLEAKVKLRNYQAAIRTLMNGSRAPAHGDGVRFSDNGQFSQSLVQVGQKHKEKNGGLFDFLPNWEWVKQTLLNAVYSTYTYFLKGRAYPLMESARMQTGQHFATNLYQITMALVQQAWELLPKAFTNWAPTVGGLTKIMGYWTEARAQIAFGDRQSPLMLNLTNTLKGEYESWLTQTGPAILSGILTTVRDFFCDLVEKGGSFFLPLQKIFCDLGKAKPPDADLFRDVGNANQKTAPGQRWRGALQKMHEQQQAGQSAKWQSPQQQAPFMDRVWGLRQIRQLGRLAPKAFRTARNVTSAALIKGWGSFKKKVGDVVNAIFFPLFFQVAVPIADHMRMEISKELTSFSIDFMIESLLMTPLRNNYLEFLGDDPAIAIIHGYASTALLPAIFESSFMADLEKRIRNAYMKWLLSGASFQILSKKWIWSAYKKIVRVGRRPTGAQVDVLADLQEDQICSTIEAPPECSDDNILEEDGQQQQQTQQRQTQQRQKRASAGRTRRLK